MKSNFHRLLLCLAPMILSPLDTVSAWEPTKPIEFVIPAGTGGGADQMARLMAGIAISTSSRLDLLSWSINPAAQAQKVFWT